MNRKTLVALDEGGVHETVIDLMIALTYPKKFVVRASRRVGRPHRHLDRVRMVRSADVAADVAMGS